jgi:hypothetical protein
VLNIKRSDCGMLTQSAQASNKKTANAQCALSMIRELYRRNLIEKFGEKRICGAYVTEQMDVNGDTGENIFFTKNFFWKKTSCLLLIATKKPQIAKTFHQTF